MQRFVATKGFYSEQGGSFFYFVFEDILFIKGLGDLDPCALGILAGNTSTDLVTYWMRACEVGKANCHVPRSLKIKYGQELELYTLILSLKSFMRMRILNEVHFTKNHFCTV